MTTSKAITDKTIKGWIKRGEHFESRTVEDGLALCYRETFVYPVWRLRYQLGGKRSVMTMGSYRDISLAEARKMAKELRCKAALGFDPGAEKQQRIKTAVAQREAKQNEWTVSRLADEYYARRIEGRLKHPQKVMNQIDRDIRPHLGKLAADAVTPMMIDAILQSIVARCAPTTANDILRLIRKIFDFGITRHILTINPAGAFGLLDAGGQEKARDRNLSDDEIIQLFAAMRDTQGFHAQNYHTIKLLLLLGVRKEELTAAPTDEFDLDTKVWRLPATRTKTGVAIDIALSESALLSLRELIRLGCSSPWLLPARKAQSRMLPHICENTLNAAMRKVRRGLPDMVPFTIHDLRRTFSTQLGTHQCATEFIRERCLNHKPPGVEGIYDRCEYFEERKVALSRWAEILDALEEGRKLTPESDNVIPIRRASP